MIKLSAVSAFYGKKKILNNIDLEIPRGGITAIIGPNGAGKSTLASVIARLTPMSGGLIEIDNQPINSINAKEFALILSYMEQDNTIFARLKVRELVEFGRFPHHQGKASKEDKAMVDEAITLFDLDAMSSRFVDTLSGGERQRVRAAMCYCQATDYLLLDEPFNNLDIFYSKQLLNILQKIAKEQGKTIIIVMHDINQAASNADHIVALKKGEVIAAGLTHDVITPEILDTLFGFPIEVSNVNGKLVCMYF